MKDTVIAIVGPTAVGKTQLSLEVAKKFNGEIISGDSMQIYRGMDIGTAKILPEERQGIPHYMIDIKDPHETFSVAEFQATVQQYIKQITDRNKLPIIVGGSGLYIQATLFNYNFSQHSHDVNVRRKLEDEMEKHGINTLYERLTNIDPTQARKIHPNNHRRVIRALEVFEVTGKTMTQLQQEQSRESPYHPIIIGLEMERNLLYQRINERVDLMIEQGLETEVRSLYESGLKDTQAMKAIGYKEFIPYFEGQQSYKETVDLLKRNSRRYAKRQYTWFKNKLDQIHWYDLEPETIYEKFATILTDLAGLLNKK